MYWDILLSVNICFSFEDILILRSSSGKYNFIESKYAAKTISTCAIWACSYFVEKSVNFCFVNTFAMFFIDFSIIGFAPSIVAPFTTFVINATSLHIIPGKKRSATSNTPLIQSQISYLLSFRILHIPENDVLSIICLSITFLL